MYRYADSARRTFLLACKLVLILGVARFAQTSTAEAQAFTDPGFTAEVVTTLPPYSTIGLTWAPDGRMFISQKRGVIRVFKNGVLLPTPFLDISSQVNQYLDRGMLGVALHPNFAENGYVYILFTREEGSDTNNSGPKVSRLIRVTADPANPDVALAGSTVIILGSVGTPPCSVQPAGADCIPSDAESHSIGTLRFGLDGKLFVGIGDGAGVAGTDPLAFRSQDLNIPAGKILRVNDDGTAPGDNPYDDGTNSWRSKVWIYGVRNPYRFAVHPTREELLIGDVGWNTWEEINRGTRGGNYGWPCFEGALPQPEYQAYPACLSVPSSIVTMPLVSFAHADASPALPGYNPNFLGDTAIGGAVYTGAAYPQLYQGNFFYAEYVYGWIRRLIFDGAGNMTANTVFTTGEPGIVSLEQGPDGHLYYVAFPSGQIRRIRFNGPVAKITASPTSGASPLSVAFSSAASLNPGGGSLTYAWAFGDGGTSTAANPTHLYTAAGVQTFTAQLTVTATNNQTSSATTSITLGSTPPQATITTPADGTTIMPGQQVAYQGTGTDPQDGALPPSALSWNVLLHHNDHVHVLQTSTGSSGSFVTQYHGVGTYSYEIKLTATDSSGLTDTRSVNMPVLQDAVPPTAPTGFAALPTSSSKVSLSWTASTDNAGVIDYRVERCLGAACSNFSQIATPTATSYEDTGLTASTTYRYRVRAVDGTGNLSPYSAIVNATTLPPSTAPVAAYGFNEGSGATTADASGNTNTGSLIGSTWAAGKYGSALTFDGTNDLVLVNHSTSLNLTTAMTLEAWVYPTALTSGWHAIMQKEVDAYFLHALGSSGALDPTAGGIFDGSLSYFPATLPMTANTWNHVAVTWNGSVMQLYVNGVAAASIPRTGTLTSTSGPLRIGGNTYGEFFLGRIDEVRIYNRALSAAEVQTDMSTPIGPVGPDTTPPTNPSVLAATAASATQVNLTWTASTDNVGVTGYLLERCTGSGCSNFAQIATPSGPSFSDTTAAASTSYNYRVRAVDAAGNSSGYSNTASATTPILDVTPPTAPGSLGAAAASATQINVSWTAATDNVGVTGYELERCQGSGCSSFALISTLTATSASNTGLTASTSYSYRVRAFDAAGNRGAYSNIASATTLAPPDTTAPTAPTALAATPVSTSQINLGWTASTDNVAVTGYQIERCLGTACSTFAQIGTSVTTTFNDTGLPASTTYRYRVRATDAAGNLSGYSNIVTAATQGVPDTTPPSVPTGLAATAASGVQINLAWTASTDNVGVTGYLLERCQGGGCSSFAQIATPTTTTYSDIGLTASTSYSYRVRATDSAGNQSGYSTVASATTLAPALGPVAAYSFDEAAGATAADSSGNTNNGTLTNGPTWTPSGKYGSAINFDGTNDLVVINHSSSLALSTAMTLEAWVFPTAAQSGWRTIMQKEVDAYFLHASGLSPLAPVAGATFSTGVDYFGAPSAITVNAWSHVAVTWNGTIMRLYVNGTEVATRARTGTLQTTTTPLRIGGNSPYGEYFLGRIDEVRVYNRALSAAEVTTDMNTPVGPVAPDTTPPSVPAGLAATAVTPTQINVTWTAATDNVGVTGYLLERCQNAGCSSFVQIATPTGASFNDTGVVASTTYSYRVRATDAAGNNSGYSNTASATTPTPDTTPPTAPATLTATPFSATQINLGWSAATDNVGVVNYELERCQGAGCSSFALISTLAGTSASNTGLTASTSYSYRVRALDAAGNAGPYSVIASATTLPPPDTTAPTAPTGLGGTPVSTSQINLSWTASTDNVAVTGYQIDRCIGTGCSSFAQIGTSPTPGFNDTGLTASTTYRYRVRATDAAGNVSANSSIVNAATQGVPDTTPPTAPSGLSATAISATQINLAWTASTDNIGVTGYRVERCLGPACSSFAQIATPTATTYSDTGLTASTSYSYRVLATDSAGNLSGYSSTASATTPAVTAPAGPAVAYSFNEGAGVTATDASGNGVNGTLTGGPTWTPGQTLTALSFDGSDDKVALPSTFDVAALPFTMEAWIRPTNRSSYHVIFSKRSSYTAAGMRFDIGLWSGTGQMYVTTYNSLRLFTYAAPLTTWTHIAVVATSTGTTLYVNGALQETAAAVTLGTGSGAAVNVGRTGDNDDAYAGAIDDLRVYKRALSQAEIQTDLSTPVTP